MDMRRNLWWRQTMWKKRRSLYIALHVYLYLILYLLLLVNWTFIFSSHRVILSESTNCHSDTENIGTYEITTFWNLLLIKTKTLDLDIHYHKSWHTLSQVLTYIITSLDFHYHKSWHTLSQVLSYQTCCYTSENVCLDLHNWCYSI